ncbi:P-loop NTPase fold protein, partial [Acidovorax sp. Root217]|uniref:P-loop NTPase fold protein n=1 Tax=Acidovorax sp. Root217 TaxID=1736492 RepID=UPI001910CA3F
MGLAETKNALEQILITSDAKVVALSGKWGTGKSYMWDEIRREGQVSALNEAADSKAKRNTLDFNEQGWSAAG